MKRLAHAAAAAVALAISLALGATAAAGITSSPPAARASGPPGVPAAPPRVPPPPPEPLIAILCYHDLAGDPKARLDTVSPGFLRAQIRASKAAGWTFLSLGELLALRDRPELMPPRVMVLTFDDGYRSFMTEALPILREEGVKTTLAVITSFVGTSQPNLPPLMSWDQIREVEKSGLVEIASHSHDLHRFETSNPYRDTGPSVATRRYLLEEARYETRDEYRERVRGDLDESRRRLETELGHAVGTLVWPYGERNEMVEILARRAGFATTLSLGWRETRRADLEARSLPRVMVVRTMDFAKDDLAWMREPARPVRAAQVDLDDVYDPDPAALRRQVDRMVSRVKAIGATHVFLQACADPAGDGMLRRAYFMNHQLPVMADVWSMVAAKLAHERVKVWIRAPSMNLSWIWEQRPEWRIPIQSPRGAPEKKPWYYRLSPNLPEARRAAIDFFADIAVYLPIEGVLFDDDAHMLPNESLNGSLGSDPRAKDEAIRGLLADVKSAVRAWRPECQFGRNLYAPVVDRNGVHPGFAQDFGGTLGEYDLTVVMAYARMEGHRRDAAAWAGAIARRALKRWRPIARDAVSQALAKRAAPLPPVMLKFQAYDWETKAWVPASELVEMVAQAKAAGVAHLGLYPVPPTHGEIPDHLLEAAPRTGVAIEGGAGK